MWVSKDEPFHLDLPSKRGSGCHLLGAISNRKAAMRFLVYPVVPKKNREAEEEMGKLYLRFVKQLDGYYKAPTRTVVVMDGAQIHRNKECREHLQHRGVSLFFLPPSSSEL